MNLYLIRHGEPAIPEGHLQDDFPLTELGQRQAQALSEKLKAIPIDHLFSSPLIRARQTADVIGRPRNLSIRIEEDFREMKAGEITGMSRQELFERFGTYLNERPYPLMEYGYAQGETPVQFHDRVIKAFEKQIWTPFSKSAAQVVLVAHGGVICVILLHFLGLVFDGYLTFFVDFTGVSKIDTRHGRPRIRTVNDTHHLRETNLL